VTPLTFAQAAELYRTKRHTREGWVRLAHRTWLIPQILEPKDPKSREPQTNAFAVRFHNTDIVLIHFDDTYTLTTGGWWTSTTKARIQEYAPVRLAQIGGLWYLSAGEDQITRKAFLFHDNIIVNTRGIPLTPLLSYEKIEKAKRQLDRHVAKYIKGFAAYVREHGLEAPSSGDCFGCRYGKGESEGKTYAEPMGLDHYREHFTEGYYVPSLLWNAILERGYEHPGYIWQNLTSREASRWHGDRTLQLVLRRFFMRRKPALLGLTDTVPTKTRPVTEGQAVGASVARNKQTGWGR
jgi:hypothetical protein